MATAKITKRTVDSATPTDKTFVLYDTDLAGFGLRVTPNGAKSFIAEYRLRGAGRMGAKKRVTLGRYGVLTVDQARQEAKNLLASVRLGKDPLAERAAEVSSPTLSELAGKFLRDHVDAKRKAQTRREYRRLFDKVILPAIGKKRADDITRSEISALHQRIGAQTPTQANRVVAILSSMLSWGMHQGLVKERPNPATGIEKFREASKERFLSNEELYRLGTVLRDAEEKGLPLPNGRIMQVSPYVTAAIRLALFTGCRIGEILHLQWSEIDFDRATATLGDSKVGRRVVILAPPAIAALNTLERIGQYVIVGRDPDKPRADIKRAWIVIRAAAGLEDVRLHDLRHTHASYGASAGIGLPIIGKLLGHTQAATTARYAHLADDPVRLAAGRVAGDIASSLERAAHQESVDR